MVLRQDGPDVAVVGLNQSAPGLQDYFPGDTLRFFRFAAGQTAERKVVSVAPAATPSDLEALKERSLKVAAASRFSRTVKVVLDSPVPLQPGDRVLDTRLCRPRI